jgi:uncharacterized membrane protein (DUF4010 family)
VAGLILVFNYQLGLRTLPYLAPPFVAGGLMLLVLLKSKGSARDTPFARNPLRIGAAIQMALLFQAFLYLVEWARSAFGSTGILASAAVLGSTDMDALTFSMVKYASEGEQIAVAARALAIGLLSNTIVKLLMALSIGRGEYRRYSVMGLGLLAAAGAAAIVWL